MKKICAKLRALFYLPFFIISVLIVFICFYTTRSQDKIWRIRRAWARLQGSFWGLKFELEGKLDAQASLIVMNHQSMLDIIALEALYPKNLCWIAKKELGELPVFKIAMHKPKLLCIDRQNPRDLVRVPKLAKERLNEGRVLAIFPEGTRSKSQKMLKFQSGARVLAEKLSLKVQPILIVDSAKIMDSKAFSFYRGKLRLIATPCVDTSEAGWLEKTRKTMQAKLEQERQN